MRWQDGSLLLGLEVWLTVLAAVLCLQHMTISAIMTRSILSDLTLYTASMLLINTLIGMAVVAGITRQSRLHNATGATYAATANSLLMIGVIGVMLSFVLLVAPFVQLIQQGTGTPQRLLLVGTANAGISLSNRFIADALVIGHRHEPSSELYKLAMLFYQTPLVVCVVVCGFAVYLLIRQPQNKKPVAIHA